MGRIRLLVVGAGGHGRSVAEAAELGGIHEVVGFLDDSLPSSEKVLGYPVLGPVANIASHRANCDQIIVAVGNNAARMALFEQLANAGFEMATVIHPSAFISARAVVGKGTVVMASAVVGTEARLGVGVILNCGAVVDHHAHVEDFAHLGVNACMAGGSVLGSGAWMQAGAALGYGVVIPPLVSLEPGAAVSNKRAFIAD